MKNPVGEAIAWRDAGEYSEWPVVWWDSSLTL